MPPNSARPADCPNCRGLEARLARVEAQQTHLRQMLDVGRRMLEALKTEDPLEVRLLAVEMDLLMGGENV